MTSTVIYNVMCRSVFIYKEGNHESSSSDESMVSTVPPAFPPPPDEEPDNDVTRDKMEPSPPPPLPPWLEEPPDAPPSSDVTAWILGPSNCNLGCRTWPTIPLSEAKPPLVGASIPYCLLISIF